MHGMLKDMEYSNVTFTILIPKGLDIRKVGNIPGKFYECQVAVHTFSFISSCLRMGSLSPEVCKSIFIYLIPWSYDNIMIFLWFALCVPWKPRVHYPFPDERQHKDFFSCVYLAITGIYSFCLWNRKATNCYLCRCLGGRTLSSSGWASAIEVKWNRHRPYLASINFGFGFCLVLIWSYSYAKFIAGGAF